MTNAYQKKIKSGYYVLNGEGEYLYYNKAFFKGGYRFKKGKYGAGKFTRSETERIFKYLKSQGHYDIHKKKIR